MTPSPNMSLAGALRRSVVRAVPRVAQTPRVAARRAYSTVPPPSSGGGAPWIQLALAAGVGAAGGAFALNTFGGGSDLKREAETAVKGAGRVAKVAANFVPKKEDYQKVYDHIADILDAGEYDDGSYGPVFVRLAWHSSGTYDEETKTGGSNYATMRFQPESLHGANNGLNIARAKMEEVKQTFPWISYGDLWTLGGVCAIQEMGGPKVPWRPGRIDGFEKDVTPDGRLPDATQAQDHLRAIFYRMGFNDQEIVALSGAHALGRCHTDRSGFEGPWTFSPTTLTNEYYKLLLNEKWQWRKWGGPKQLEDKTTKTLMMLPTDYCLVQDKKFKPWVQKYADSEELFFKDFSSVVNRLFELGVPVSQFGETILFRKTEEK
ncbi:heme peroxidase [Ceratobasidium sp. UAMH 11750]|nr:heme peroxidase [Ceratobasidium sp. UAMH 11750]